MFLWSVQVVVLSMVFIFIVHHLFVFFMTNLTVPRTKDLVYRPAQSYDRIYELIGRKGSERTSSSLSSSSSSSSEGTSLDDLQLRANTEFNASSGKQSMKDELKSFLKKQWHQSRNATPSSDAWAFDSDAFSVTSLQSSAF